MRAPLPPPGPTLPVLAGDGDAHLQGILAGPLRFFTAAARPHPDGYRFDIGDVSLVVPIHPSLVDEVLVRRWKAFPKAAEAGAPLFGKGLITAAGDLWRRQRGLMQGDFAAERTAPFGALTTTAAEAAVDAIDPTAPLDVARWLKPLMFGNACRTLFGADAAFDEGLAGAFETFQRVGAPGFLRLLGRRVPDPPPELLAARAHVRAWVDALIDRREAEGATGDDLLSRLLRARDEAGGMSRAQLHDEVMTLMLAGHETTETAVLWTIALLATRPALRAAVAAECSADDAPTPERRPLLHRVLQEAMRYRPPVWQLVARDAREAGELGPWELPPNARVLVLPWLVHRHAGAWEEPERFDPDRFLGERDIPAGAYVPFGAGPRVCIGKHLGTGQAVRVLAALARRFDFEMDAEVTPRVFGPVLAPAEGVVVRVRGR